MTLEVGNRIRSNHAARKLKELRRVCPHTIRANIDPTLIAAGTIVANDLATGQL
jgi:hypothetical protein